MKNYKSVAPSQNNLGNPSFYNALSLSLSLSLIFHIKSSVFMKNYKSVAPSQNNLEIHHFTMLKMKLLSSHQTHSFLRLRRLVNYSKGNHCRLGTNPSFLLSTMQCHLFNSVPFDIMQECIDNCVTVE